MNSTQPFFDRLADAMLAKRSAVCVGLDPRWQQLPESMRPENCDSKQKAAAFGKFCREVIDVVASHVPAVKPQSAFFEQLGPAGSAALFDTMTYASSKGLLVILDAKRNDIGSTAEAYANAYLGAHDESQCEADALTVSPYLGDDSLQPFVDRCNQTQSGIFVLVKTSNPGSGFLQNLRIDSSTIAERVADWVQRESSKRVGKFGYGAIGAVVGATYPDELAAMRTRMPASWILVPGYGAQGGSAKDVAAGFDSNGLGAIVNNSRGIIFAYESKKYSHASSWQTAVERATVEMNQALKGEIGMK